MMNMNKIRLFILVLIVFLFVSFLFINPIVKEPISQFHSSELKKITIKDETTEKTDFVNSDGQITIAADVGYATKIITKTENSKLEQYYDDKGEPINRSDGAYSLLREYDDDGNNIRVTYLNRDGNPMITRYGYAAEAREYNEENKVTCIKYYDTDGNLILTPLYGYGKKNYYNENGKISKVTYIDASGNPMMTGQGYACISYSYYLTEGHENGKIEREFYFNEIGKPVRLSLGQCGVYKEYNEYGNLATLTYLGYDGKPIVTKRGYTTVAYTYQTNKHSIATERYYDLKGNPYSLSEGQYGIMRDKKGRTIYLDQEGKEIFNLKRLLYNHAWLVILFAIILVILSCITKKRMNVILLLLYIGSIIYMTLMFRENSDELRISFLWSYRQLFSDSNARADIIKNIWLFIPLGAVLYRMYPKTIVLLIPIMLSFIIECIQSLSGLGYSELDDIISNGLGGAMGYYLGKFTSETIHHIKKRKYAKSA